MAIRADDVDLGRAGRSAQLARAVVDIDRVRGMAVESGRTDGTVAIARRYTPHVEVREWAGYGPQKNYAASRASHDWILSIDADERITPALAAEIQALMASIRSTGSRAIRARCRSSSASRQSASMT